MNLNSGAPRVTEPRSVELPSKPAPKDDEDRSDSDWGLAPTKPGLTRENKFILFVLLVLVAVFSFVVFRNFQKKKDPQAGDEVAAKDDQTKDPKKAGKEPKPLSEVVDESGETPTLAEDGQMSAEDPFGTGGESTDTSAATTGRTAGRTKLKTEVDQEPDLTATGDDQAPAQAFDTSDRTDATAENAPGQDGFEVANDPTETAEPAEIGTAVAATQNHRRSRGVHSHPAAVENSVETPAEITEDSTTASDFGIDSTEIVTDTELTQTGGTAGLETPPKKGAASLKDEFAQTTTDLTETQDTQTTATPPTVTNPRSATSPRSTTNPRSTTSPRAAIPPAPPLDPRDEKLGGYREASVDSPNRQHTHVATNQFEVQHEPLVANQGEYIVRPHDNFSRISRKLYGTSRFFAALAKHNEQVAPNPKMMKPGLKISTPTPQELQQAYRDLIPAPATPRPAGAMINPPHAPKNPGYFIKPDGQPAYRVGGNDSLSSIAKKTLNRTTRWDEIYELNKDRLASADDLPIGTILRLPPDASQTRVVSKPIEHH